MKSTLNLERCVSSWQASHTPQVAPRLLIELSCSKDIMVEDSHQVHTKLSSQCAASHYDTVEIDFRQRSSVID
jgi:hypothetical protein